ncbi:MAG: helix-turn-helix domain-containing protein [Theionarchaea archaeon]|nr:helix-turn-helix domain-containing protein [Theionarchaea archaeon]
MYIPRILGSDILLALLEYGKNVKVIVLPPSLYVQTSQRVRTYADNARVILKEGQHPVGRPPKYSTETIRKIYQLKDQGIPIIQISRELHIPRRTLYYLMDREQDSDE